MLFFRYVRAAARWRPGRAVATCRRRCRQDGIRRQPQAHLRRASNPPYPLSRHSTHSTQRAVRHAGLALSPPRAVSAPPCQPAGPRRASGLRPQGREDRRGPSHQPGTVKIGAVAARRPNAHPGDGVLQRRWAARSVPSQHRCHGKPKTKRGCASPFSCRSERGGGGGRVRPGSHPIAHKAFKRPACPMQPTRQSRAQNEGLQRLRVFSRAQQAQRHALSSETSIKTSQHRGANQ